VWLSPLHDAAMPGKKMVNFDQSAKTAQKCQKTFAWFDR
jgi:hypothetical protein